MIYDYIFGTGDESISGCDSANLGTNWINEINKTSPNGGEVFYFDASVVTGDEDMLLTLNGQTLFQEPPATGQATNEIIYQIKSGDYFVKTKGASLVEKSTLFFASNVPVKPTSNISYAKDSGKSFIGTGMNGGSGIGNSLGSGISGTFPSGSFDQFDFFLNGLKVNSGMGVSGYMEGEMTTFIPNFVEGGIVTAENEASFTATAYLKRTRTSEVTGVSPDVFGSSFIEKRTKLYVNGIEKPPSSYLELYSGVSSIEAGVSAKVGRFGPTTAHKNLQL
jgi:hypothetical protein|tara:strand:- start:3228 stop:4061 length:834 start_codon:yes stop_codon:yes gene_type:complete